MNFSGALRIFSIEEDDRKGGQDEQKAEKKKKKRDRYDPVFEYCDPGGRRDTLWPDERDFRRKTEEYDYGQG